MNLTRVSKKIVVYMTLEV